MSENGLADQVGEFFVLAGGLRVFKVGPLADEPSDRALARAAGVSPTTVGDWLRGRRFPQDIGKVLAIVRLVRDTAAARGVAAPATGPAGLLEENRWRAAHRREASRRAGVVAGEVQRARAVSVLAGSAARMRVREADLRRLGVHAAISVPGMPDGIPPEYVRRDADTDEHGVRAKVASAAVRSGFILLAGGSSVGKTRCAAEAVKELLPDWWLVHPPGPGEIAVLAAAPPARTVVWLDELQRYLAGEHGLTGGTVRALLNASSPVVIIATLWPDWYAAYTALPAYGGPDLRAREREVLDLATVIRISGQFSRAEQDRARAAAARDLRVKVALGAAGYGLTQTLAAAPQLVARWEDAQAANPFAWAVLTAALDAARLGARAPLSPGFLRAAAPGYCTSVQQAQAPADWFEQALAYATARLHGAAAALAPVGAGMGQIDGYTVADYLIQHARRQRSAARIPASTWDAFLSNTRDPADARILAFAAQERLLYSYAIPLYRHAVDAGNDDAGNEVASLLADLLARCGDLDEALQILRARADAGDRHAARRLADLLARRGDLDEALQILRGRADAGDRHAAYRLAGLLARRGDLDELRARADTGNGHAAWLLAMRSDLNQLRARADAGDRHAAYRLADLLARRGDLDEALQILRGRAADDGYAARRLADLLARRGDVDGITQILGVLRDHADAGDRYAARWLAWQLARRGDIEELRARADAGDREAAERLAWLLGRRGNLEELRARAETGVGVHALIQLDKLLAKRGDLEELRARADIGDRYAARLLAKLLAKHGDLEELRAHVDAGHKGADELAHLLARRGDLDQLHARADAGDGAAAERLAGLLAERGDLDEAVQILRARASAGNGTAHWLAVLLTHQGRGEEAARLRRFGLNPDGSTASG